MIRKLRISISKPKMTVFFIKDRFSSVILYMLLLTTLLIIPNLIKISVNKDFDIERKDKLHETFKAFNDFSFEDGKLIVTKYENAYFDTFNISLGRTDLEMRFNIIFSDEELIFYAATRELKRTSYKDLGLNNFVLNKDNLPNYQILTNIVTDFVKSESSIYVADIFYDYFVGLMDYILISVMLVFMTMFFPINLKLSFINRLTLTIYLMSSWVLSQLIVKLFQIEFLEIISLVIVYIYHVILYRFLKTVKVEIVNVDK